MAKRVRRIGSVKQELIVKSREAAMAAVQIFNNPNIQFKSEIFIVLIIISWTYLLHAYYRSIGVDYRYFSYKGKRKKYDTTKKGAHKYWELERCLCDDKCPIDSVVVNNIKFLIGIRHEIEHQMTTRIDELLSAKFQACCINYNDYLKRFFGDELGIDKHLSFSLQFSSLSETQVDLLSNSNLPPNISAYIDDFDDSISDEEYNSPRYAYRVLFVPKIANRKGQADKVIEFIKADSELAEKVNISYALVRERERQKYLPKQIVHIMQQEGFTKFRIHEHTELWQSLDARKPGKGYGVLVVGTWYWYDNWLALVKKHCKDNQERYT